MLAIRSVIYCATQCLICCCCGGSGNANHQPVGQPGAVAARTASGASQTAAASTQRESTSRVTRACPIPVAAVGVWQNVTPPQIPLTRQSVGIVSVAVNPRAPGTVFTSGAVSADAGKANGIYKSIDCGNTWTKLNTGRNAAAIDSGYQWQILVDPVDPEVMYVSNGYGNPLSLFKSTDGGVNWDAVFPPESEVAKTVEYNFTQAVSMDPKNHEHLLVSFHANCRAPYAPTCLAESSDGGRKWKLLKGPTASWLEGAGPLVIDGASFLYATLFDGLFYTADDGANWKKVAPGGSGNQLFIAPDGALYTGSAQFGVQRSMDRGRSWSSIPSSPNAIGIIGDGTTLFATFQNDTSGQPFYSASQSDPSRWINVKTPTIGAGGSVLAYDAENHILYSSNYFAGLWRVVTRAD